MALSFSPLMVYGESQLCWLPPGMRDAFAATRADAAGQGITIAVSDFGGARTPGITEQLTAWRDAAVAKGEPWYRVSPFALGKHGVGGAVDFRIVSRPATMSEETALARVGALGRNHGLLWGGNFRASGGAADPWHLESQWSRDQLAVRWDAWTQSPDYPRLGAADWTVLVVLAALFIVGGFFLFQRG